MVPSIDDTMDHPRISAIPWHVPWVPVTYSMDVHHGSNHGVVHGAPWTALRTAPWLSPNHGILHGTYHGPMDESSSMGWFMASFIDDHGFVRGRRHRVVCPWHRPWTMPWKAQ